MNGSLPTPVLQEVLNSSPRIFISWRSLGNNNLFVRIKLFDNSGLIQTDSSDPGSIFYQLVPNQPLNNPPYTIRLAATDGTNTGPDSVAVPVIVYTPVVSELKYDTVTVSVRLKAPSPPPSPDTYYVMTIFKDGAGENSPPFPGLDGAGPLDHAPATAECHATVVANQDTPQGQFSCTSTGPSSAPVGIITQTATIDRVQFFTGGTVEVDATGPTSVGPPINGHRSTSGSAICNGHLLPDFTDAPGVLSKDFDGDTGVLELTAEFDPSQPMCVITAGTSKNGDTTSVGPFSAPLQIITQAPTFLSLMSTTANALIANWSAVPPPPSGGVSYIVELFRDSNLIDQRSTSQLHFTFAVQFERGRVYALAIMATADQGKVIGPVSEQAPGPFMSNAPTAVYDSLGRLVSMSITGYRNLTYTLDDFGNIKKTTVSNNNA